MAVTVLVADAPVRPMDHDFRPLIAGNATRGIDCLVLGAVGRGDAAIALTANCPCVTARYNVLISACGHRSLLGVQVHPTVATFV
jgi:hypothetical protein